MRRVSSAMRSVMCCFFAPIFTSLYGTVFTIYSTTKKLEIYNCIINAERLYVAVHSKRNYHIIGGGKLAMPKYCEIFFVSN